MQHLAAAQHSPQTGVSGAHRDGKPRIYLEVLRGLRLWLFQCLSSWRRTVWPASWPAASSPTTTTRHKRRWMSGGSSSRFRPNPAPRATTPRLCSLKLLSVKCKSVHATVVHSAIVSNTWKYSIFSQPTFECATRAASFSCTETCRRKCWSKQEVWRRRRASKRPVRWSRDCARRQHLGSVTPWFALRRTVCVLPNLSVHSVQINQHYRP